LPRRRLLLETEQAVWACLKSACLVKVDVAVESENIQLSGLYAAT